jgi:hypothetical protein
MDVHISSYVAHEFEPSARLSYETHSRDRHLKIWSRASHSEAIAKRIISSAAQYCDNEGWTQLAHVSAKWHIFVNTNRTLRVLKKRGSDCEERCKYQFWSRTVACHKISTATQIHKEQKWTLLFINPQPCCRMSGTLLDVKLDSTCHVRFPLAPYERGLS